ncbi:MAG: dCTP deaminase [Clostridia bacterium]
MILSGNEIKKEIENGGIEILPYNESRVNPNSYNLSLHNELIEYDDDILDMKTPNKTHKVIIPEEGYLIKPGKLYLGRTVEYTKTDLYAPMLEGRSSIGRLGISVHSTAGFGDIGFAGTWTLEISCIQPVKIYPNTQVCQICYHNVQGDTTMQYRGKYFKQEAATASNMFKDFEV